jgi:hypothetical protein
MPAPLSLARELREEDFILANGTIVYLKGLAAGVSIPPIATLTVAAGGAAINATSIPLLAPLPDKLFAGSKLKFGTNEVTVISDVAAGLSAIPVEALVTAIAAAATATTKFLAPLYSSNNASTNKDDNMTESRNFLSGIWRSKRITARGYEISISGFVVRNDPGAAIVKTWSDLYDKVYFEIHDADGTGDTGSAFISKYNYKRQEDQNNEISFTLMGDGALGTIIP